MEINPIVITGIFAVTVALLAGIIAHYAASSKTEKDITLIKLEQLGIDNILILTYHHNVISALILYFELRNSNSKLIELQAYMTKFESENTPSLLSDLMKKTKLINRIFIPEQSQFYEDLIIKTNDYRRKVLNHTTVNHPQSNIIFYNKYQIDKLTSEAKNILNELESLGDNINIQICKKYKNTLSSSRKIIFTIFFILLIIISSIIYLSTGSKTYSDRQITNPVNINIKISASHHSFQGTPYRLPEDD